MKAPMITGMITKIKFFFGIDTPLHNSVVQQYLVKLILAFVVVVAVQFPVPEPRSIALLLLVETNFFTENKRKVGQKLFEILTVQKVEVAFESSATTPLPVELND